MWIDQARDELLNLRGGLPGWGYRRDSAPMVEATSLAALALLATDRAAPSPEARPAIAGAAEWLAKLQQKDGSLGVSEQIPQPHWPTAFAALLWAALEGYQTAGSKAVAWLRKRRGTTWDPPADTPLGHDTRIPGWPWVANTHSWLEPTAMATMALCRYGLAGDSRTQSGIAMIRDRALPSGGWNFGNNLVFGAELRPRPAPTGLALLALAASVGDGFATGPETEMPETVAKAVAYLQRALPTIRSGQSVCWGLLGLAAWGRRPEDADEWLREASGPARRRSGAVAELAYLLLAAGGGSLKLLGVEQNLPSAA